MEGTTAVVTGASRGIGAAVAREFAAVGAHVVLCSRDADAVERVVEEIAAVDGDATGLRADVRDEYDVERLMEVAARTGEGGVDVVVANAGVYHGTPGQTPLPQESYAAFDDTVRTNVRGVFATVREAVPHMPSDGRVLVPSGSVASSAAPGFGTYAVSKAAAEALMRGFAADLDQAVGCLDPGQVATDITDGRGRDPADVAPMFVWAARDLDAVALDGAVYGVKDWAES